MSRRDTLIIAVLVNAGLLMVLFATALKSDRKKIHYAEDQVVTEIAMEPSCAEISMPSKISESSGLPPTLHLPVLEETSVASVPTLTTPSSPASLPSRSTPPVMPVESLPMAPMSSAPMTVTVKKGDVLERIARNNQTTVAALMQENQLTSTQLKIGQVLKLPGQRDQGSKSTPQNITPVVKQNQEDIYVVKEGDSPWVIASKHHLRVEELLRLNGLDEQSARRIRPGQKLKIR